MTVPLALIIILAKKYACFLYIAYLSSFIRQIVKALLFRIIKVCLFYILKGETNSTYYALKKFYFKPTEPKTPIRNVRSVL